MNFRRFLHTLAIMCSSILAMVSHGKADTAFVKNGKKSDASQFSKPAGVKSEDAKQDPPPQKNEGSNVTLKLDPTQIANPNDGLQGTLFRPLGAMVIPESPASDANSEKTHFPWKQKIVTTTFWVGETPTINNPVPNTQSSWDKNWVANYGGFDTPDSHARKEFIPVNFTPRQNPFYVALPYNDMERTGFKAEASKVVPWFKSAYQGPLQSVCKDHWVAIRYNNKVVYAQWEDCGPFRTDHWEYVFGDERPKPNLNHGAGLDVSPAVRDYLGMNDTDVTDWRFVDIEEVPPGPWTKHGENNPFVLNQRKETDRLAENQRKEMQRLGDERDRLFQQNGYQ